MNLFIQLAYWVWPCHYRYTTKNQCITKFALSSIYSKVFTDVFHAIIHRMIGHKARKPIKIVQSYEMMGL